MSHVGWSRGHDPQVAEFWPHCFTIIPSDSGEFGVRMATSKVQASGPCRFDEVMKVKYPQHLRISKAAASCTAG